MGQNMVYRYRPMRLVPTITTRVIIVTGPFMLGGTLWGAARGVNWEMP